MIATAQAGRNLDMDWIREMVEEAVLSYMRNWLTQQLEDAT